MAIIKHEWSSKDRKKPSELASTIGRDIFSMGDHPLNDDKAHRIEFKGGDYPDGETDLGGLCEKSLADRIDASLRDAGVKQDRIMFNDEMQKITVTTRLTNGQSHAFKSFERATATVKGPFVIIHHEKKDRAMTDWFSVGSVLRVEIRPRSVSEVQE